jgi:hypothetical protein
MEESKERKREKRKLISEAAADWRTRTHAQFLLTLA